MIEALKMGRELLTAIKELTKEIRHLTALLEGLTAEESNEVYGQLLSIQ